ncbi:EamA family transporter [Flavobacterium sp.]|uniref:EamA family transporter n=1 Tax=Flavobacterium sp. TaxID=239 RepID=UPI002FD98FFA
MIFIILSVLFNSVLFVILKLFTKFKVNTLQALVVNYLTAFTLGFFLADFPSNYNQIIQKSWFTGSFLLGFLFISVFYVTALTSQRNGLSVASVASKMSVIIPIAFGILLFKENLGILKIGGILLALVAVYFTSKKEKGKITEKTNLLYPILVFFGAGAIDTSLKILQHFHMESSEIPLFSAHTFLMAFGVGSLLVLSKVVIHKEKIYGKSILAGIILGIPNYFSLFYLIKMLESQVFESATLFTLHNIAIVLVTTLTGIVFFKERITPRNALGIGLAVVALFLITF